QFAFPPRQLQREKMYVAIQERAHVFVGRRNFMLAQDAHHDARIGHAGDFDVTKIIVDAETLLERTNERLHTRAPGMNQSAINIKKKKTFVCLCHLEAMMKSRMTNDERMTKVKLPKFSLPNAHHFQVSSFGFVSAFDIRASSLTLEISLLGYLPRNSSKAWRMHH